MKFSSYFREEYNEGDHNQEFEDVEIGGEVYRVKKKPVNRNRRNKYKPLPPVPKRKKLTDNDDAQSCRNSYAG